MPIKTIKVKLQIPRKGDRALARALWTTHEQVNQAVAQYEAFLLLCRGQSYTTIGDDGESIKIPESTVAEQALKLARDAQTRNGKPGTGSDAEILAALRLIYEAVVPSAKLGDDGQPITTDAEGVSRVNGNSYAGPLLDPDAGREKGPFGDLAEKILDELPAWAKLISEDRFKRLTENDADPATLLSRPEAWYQIDLPAAGKWLADGPGKEFFETKNTGAPDRWKRLARDRNPEWAKALLQKQLELRENDPRIPIRQIAWKKLGLLPIYPAKFKKSGGMMWDRVAMILAIGSLLSWESWNHTIRANYADLSAHYNAIKDQCAEHESAIRMLREYEARRHKELAAILDVSDDKPYRIGRRAVRGWTEIRNAWISRNAESQAARKIIADELIARRRGRFGDSNLFHWLAKDGHESLWREANPLPLLVELNQTEIRLKNAKQIATYTPPDARLHPRWVPIETRGTKRYQINTPAPGVAEMKMGLLCECDGKLATKPFEFKIAPTDQMGGVTVTDGLQVRFKSAFQEFEGQLRDSSLHLSRRFMEGKTLNELQAGNIGPVMAALVVDVASKAPEDWLNKKGGIQTPAEVWHFKTALANKSKHADKIGPGGLRVMSVKLGMSTFAACSVFELVEGKPSKGTYYLADREKDLWALHERSFLLDLPGDNAGESVAKARRGAIQELRTLRRDINRLRLVLRMGRIKTRSDQASAIDGLTNSITQEGEGHTVFDIKDIERIEKFCGDPRWADECKKIYRAAEYALGIAVKRWREKKHKPRSYRRDWKHRRAYHGGLSLWHIQYLDDVRRLLKSWKYRGREYSQIRREQKDKGGVCGANLQRHTQHMKDARIKTGADLIIQSARGFVKATKGWREKYAPCRVILMEDLSAYRFRAERPRSENNALMVWSHRELMSTITNQGELYGMVVDTVQSGYCNRFRAGHGTPGIRTRKLTDGDFHNEKPKAHVVKAINGFPINVRDLRPGSRIPHDAGDEFVTLADDRLIVLNSAINAAMNLQWRFWSRYAQPFRLRGKLAKHKGRNVFYPKNGGGVQLRGGLAQMDGVKTQGYIRLEQNITDNTWLTMPATAAELSAAKSKEDNTGKVISGQDDDIQIVEKDQALPTEQTFFRDASGNFVDSQNWLPSVEFWKIVEHEICLKL